MGRKILRLCLPLLALIAATIPLAFMATCTPATAPEVDTSSSTEPSSSLLESVPRITIDELLQKMADNSNILIVDTRHADQYEVDHIKGAISVPLDTIVSGGWMPPLDKEIIFYCG
ncbi:rhodanese-like domain-containing protein [Chloroflexota bacterium]